VGAVFWQLAHLLVTYYVVSTVYLHVRERFPSLTHFQLIVYSPLVVHMVVFWPGAFFYWILELTGTPAFLTKFKIQSGTHSDLVRVCSLSLSLFLSLDILFMCCAYAYSCVCILCVCLCACVCVSLCVCVCVCIFVCMRVPLISGFLVASHYFHLCRENTSSVPRWCWPISFWFWCHCNTLRTMLTYGWETLPRSSCPLCWKCCAAWPSVWLLRRSSSTTAIVRCTTAHCIVTYTRYITVGWGVFLSWCVLLGFCSDHHYAHCGFVWRRAPGRLQGTDCNGERVRASARVRVQQRDPDHGRCALQRLPPGDHLVLGGGGHHEHAHRPFGLLLPVESVRRRSPPRLPPRELS
jgi:hypothetical protein